MIKSDNNQNKHTDSNKNPAKEHFFLSSNILTVFLDTTEVRHPTSETTQDNCGKETETSRDSKSP